MNEKDYKEYKKAFDILNGIGGICATKKEIDEAYKVMKRLNIKED